MLNAMTGKEQKNTGFGKTLAWLMALSAVGMPVAFAQEVAALQESGLTDTADANRQEQGLWNTPAARQALMALYRYHELRVEALASSMWNEGGMSPEAANVAARTMVREEGDFVARRALNSAQLAQLLSAVGADAADEAEQWKPELIWGLAEALERRNSQLAFRGDGKDAYRAEALEHVLARMDMEAVAADDLRADMEARRRSKDFKGRKGGVAASSGAHGAKGSWVRGAALASYGYDTPKSDTSSAASTASSSSAASRRGVLALADSAIAKMSMGASQPVLARAAATPLATASYSVAGESGAFCEIRDISVHFPVHLNVFDDLGIICLETAVHVVQLDAGDGPGRGIV